MSFRVAILTVSDRGARGEREDTSGDEIEKIIISQGWEVVRRDLIPDDADEIRRKLKELCDVLKVDLVLTTGGTGLSPRDITPDVTLEIIEREAPGFTPHAMLSRAVSGIRGSTLIVNLPGSPRGARENLEVIVPALPHGLSKLQGSEEECAT